MENFAARAVDKIKLLREFADRKAVEGDVLAVFRTSDVVPFHDVGHETAGSLYPAQSSLDCNCSTSACSCSTSAW